MTKCEQPTKRRFDYSLGEYLPEPGKCDNRGTIKVKGKWVCKKHLNCLFRSHEITVVDLQEIPDKYFNNRWRIR